MNLEPTSLKQRLSDASIDGLWLRERLMPRSTAGAGRPRTPPPGAPPPRQGGVLVLLYPHDGQICMPLTVRNSALREHSGEISLPGGGFHPAEDADLEHTALREAWEELGVPIEAVEPWTALTPVWIPVSNFLVTPFVGWCDARPAFVPAPDEVAALVEAPLEVLLRPDAIRLTEREIRGVAMIIPYFAVGEHVVWGATSLVLAELVGKLVPH